MSNFGPGSSPDRLLPFVTPPVIDALDRDVNELVGSDGPEKFITRGLGVMEGENEHIATILRQVADALEGDDGFDAEDRILLGGILVYRLLRNQAEAARLAELPVAEKEQ